MKKPDKVLAVILAINAYVWMIQDETTAAAIFLVAACAILRGKL